MNIYIPAILVVLFLLSCSTEDADRYRCNNEDFDRSSNEDVDRCSNPISEPYDDYPILPGTPEWYDLVTEEQRLNALQIPDSILYCLTDEALLETCINSHLYYHITASSSSTDIMVNSDKEVELFNGLKELFIRKSACRAIINRYMQEDMYQFNEIYGTSRLSYFYRFLYREEVILELDCNQRFEFIEKTIEKIETIESEDPQILCCRHIEITCYNILRRALILFNYEPFVEYHKTTNLDNYHENIKAYAISFLNEK